MIANLNKLGRKIASFRKAWIIVKAEFLEKKRNECENRSMDRKKKH